MTFIELEEARRVLGLSPQATLAEIKAAHRRLVKLYHPDSANGGDETKIRLINAAYRLIIDYCTSYRFDFSQRAFLEQNPEERLREQFAQDPIWRGR